MSGRHMGVVPDSHFTLTHPRCHEQWTVLDAAFECSGN